MIDINQKKRFCSESGTTFVGSNVVEYDRRSGVSLLGPRLAPTWSAPMPFPGWRDLYEQAVLGTQPNKVLERVQIACEAILVPCGERKISKHTGVGRNSRCSQGSDHADGTKGEHVGKAPETQSVRVRAARKGGHFLVGALGFASANRLRGFRSPRSGRNVFWRLMFGVNERRWWQQASAAWAIQN